MRKACVLLVLIATCSIVCVQAGAPPVRSTTGMVISASDIASQVGARVLQDGGNAVDAAVATAFALAVTHPSAGNIGGGGFLLFRSANGEAAAYDFRETAPARASPTMFLKDGKYDADVHHKGYLSVGVPGTVAGLHLAWRERGKLPWKRLVEPAVILARDGFLVSDGLARSLAWVLPKMQKYPSSMAQFSKDGVPYSAGDLLQQPVLASTLQRILDQGPAGFYEGPTAEAFEREMSAHGGLITREDLKRYTAVRRAPVQGTYRGYDVIAMPPPTSGGVALIEMLNIIEGYDLPALGSGSATAVHLISEAMRRAFADRAALLGDPDFNRDMPLERLLSKPYAAELRQTISRDHASKSSPTTFDWPRESDETTHLSVVDSDLNAVSLTYTLEQSYGAKIVLPGGGFLLNNEMGDFNAVPGLTSATGLIGTPANVAQPGKRMLSSMSPTILLKDGRIFMVTGSPGGRTIINTVLQTIVNVIDYGMNAQEAVDAGRFHHQWLPDRITYEQFSLSPETLAALRAKGHKVVQSGNQGVAEVIVYNAEDNLLEGGVDRRQPDGGAASPGSITAVQAAEIRDSNNVDSLAIGETFKIRSEILGEQRRINVYAPAAYGALENERFPVLYMPDGGLGEDFLHLAGLVQISSLNGTMWPFLLVGIENTERRRDLTGPTSTEQDREIAPLVGGSAAFRSFIRDELMPAINAAYRTTGETAIVGESLAGLFVVETLLVEPRLFNTYLAIDPSLWWDGERLVNTAVSLLEGQPDLRRSLYLASSNQAEIARTTGRLASLLRDGAPNVDLIYAEFPGETHLTIYHPAALDGFRKMFAPAVRE